MRKTLLLAATTALVCTSMLTSCGSYNPQQQTAPTTPANEGADLLGVLANNVAGSNNLLSDIISTFAPGITTNKNTIVGKWNYTKPCVQFESENLLAQAGGSVAAAKVEEKLVPYYQIVGIKAGVCSFTFGNDNKVSYTLGGNTHQGTYSFDSSKKTITITTQLGFQATAYVSVAGSNMALTFDATKLLSLAGGSAASIGSTVTAIIGNYKGMKIGFEFSK